MKVALPALACLAIVSGALASWSVIRTNDLEARQGDFQAEARRAREKAFENSAELEKFSSKIESVDFNQDVMLSGLQRMLAEPERKDVKRAVQSELEMIADERKFQKQVAYLESIGAPQEAERLRVQRLKILEILDRPR